MQYAILAFELGTTAVIFLLIFKVQTMTAVLGQLVEAMQEEHEECIGFRSDTAPTGEDADDIPYEYQEPDPLIYDRASKR